MCLGLTRLGIYTASSVTPIIAAVAVVSGLRAGRDRPCGYWEAYAKTRTIFPAQLFGTVQLDLAPYSYVLTFCGWNFLGDEFIPVAPCREIFNGFLQVVF